MKKKHKQTLKTFMTLAEKHLTQAMKKTELKPKKSKPTTLKRMGPKSGCKRARKQVPSISMTISLNKL